MRDARDPWQILGVARDADEQTVRRAYHRLCLRHHPDQGGNTAIFQTIKAAYDAVRGRPPPQPFSRRGDDVRETLRVPLGVALGGGRCTHRGRILRLEACSTGDTLVLMGAGLAGEGGGAAGDLLLEVEVYARPPWRIDGLHVHGPLPVSWLELYRGRTLQLTLPDGESASVALPPGSTAGALVGLAGRGLHGSDGVRGDLHLTLVAVPPPPGDRTLESVLLRLQHDAGEEARGDALAELDEEDAA